MRQLCREPSCGQRFSQLGNLKVCVLLWSYHLLTISRLMSVDILVKGHTHVMPVVNDLLSGAMFALIALFMSR